MKHHLAIALSWAIFTWLVDATGTLEYALERLPKAGSALQRRDTIEPALITNFATEDGMAYFLNVTVGTPGQLQTTQLDTGSSDFYFSAASAPFCHTLPGCAGGTFDHTKSSTFKVLDPGGFNTTFADGSTEAGDFVTDVVQIGDLVITGAQMGLAYTINSTVGANTALMGVGWSNNEGIQPGGNYYPNFMEALVGSHAIASRLYSLYLNRLEDFGSILFGGIDTSKFQGDLVTLNCLTDGGDPVDNFYLVLNEVTVKTHNGPNRTLLQSTEDQPWFILPDSGSTAWQLPAAVYKQVIQIMGVNPTYKTRACSEITRGISNTTRLQLTFSGSGNNVATLNLEMADLFTPLTNPDGSATTGNDGRPLCVLRIQPQGSDNILVVGDAVMKAGYWVFDLDNGQVSLAQAILGETSSNVVAVQAGPGGLSKAAKNIKPVESQGNSVFGYVKTSVDYALSTAASTVGYATGAQGTPRVSSAAASGAAGAASGSASARPSKSSGAAAVVHVPEFAIRFWCMSAALLTFWVAVGAMLV